MRRAVPPRRLQFQLDLACRTDLHSVIGKRWPSNVSTQSLQSLPLTRATPYRRMQAEAVQVGA
jgi:hypothetical protein